MTMLQKTPKRELFLKRMKQDRELEAYGFQILCDKDNFTEYFDLLKEFELFSVNAYPKAEKVSNGYVFNYWPAVDYLLKCAEYRGNCYLEIANKVLDVVREISAYIEIHNSSLKNNYQVTRKFCEIFGKLPLEILNFEEINLIKVWIKNSYETGMICHALSEFLIKRFFESGVDGVGRAELVFDILLSCHFDEKKDRYVAAVDIYWLNDFLIKHSRFFGRVAGAKALSLFTSKIHDAFNVGGIREHSYFYRPAIEEHEQNKFHQDYENSLINSYLAAYQGWYEIDNSGARSVISELINNELDIFRRLGFHLANIYWDDVHDIFLETLNPEYFEISNLHELYELLRAHFPKITLEEQRKIIDCIEKKYSDLDADSDSRKKSLLAVKLKWATVFRDSGVSIAKDYFDDLLKKNNYKLPNNPEFLFFMESSWVIDKPLIDDGEVLKLIQEGKLIDVLNNLSFPSGWDVPTLAGQVGCLESLISSNPSLFVDLDKDFLNAQIPYQCAYLAGFNKAWVAAIESGDIDSDEWESIWMKLLEFIEGVICQNKKMTADDSIGFNFNHFMGLSAEFIRFSFRRDELKFIEVFFDKTLIILRDFLEFPEFKKNNGLDSYLQAINLPRGKVFEAFISLALRMSRVEDLVGGTHFEAWKKVEPIFLTELSKSGEGYSVVHVLMARYSANLEYLNFEWLEKNLLNIYSKDELNFISSLGGYIYSENTLKVYELMLRHKVLDRALAIKDLPSDIRKGLLQRIGSGYLGGLGDLDSGYLKFLIDGKDYSSLGILADYFWSISRLELTEENKKLISNFRDVVVLLGDGSLEANLFLSKLSKLVCYVVDMTDSDKKFLEIVSLSVHLDGGEFFFIDSIIKLLDGHEKFFVTLLENKTNVHAPTYDFGSGWIKVMQGLSNACQYSELIVLFDNLRNIDGMSDLEDKIRVDKS